MISATLFTAAVTFLAGCTDTKTEEPEETGEPDPGETDDYSIDDCQDVTKRADIAKNEGKKIEDRFPYYIRTDVSVAVFTDVPDSTSQVLLAPDFFKNVNCQMRSVMGVEYALPWYTEPLYTVSDYSSPTSVDEVLTGHTALVEDFPDYFPQGYLFMYVAVSGSPEISLWDYSMDEGSRYAAFVISADTYSSVVAGDLSATNLVIRLLSQTMHVPMTYDAVSCAAGCSDPEAVCDDGFISGDTMTETLPDPGAEGNCTAACDTSGSDCTVTCDDTDCTPAANNMFSTYPWGVARGADATLVYEQQQYLACTYITALWGDEDAGEQDFRGEYVRELPIDFTCGEEDTAASDGAPIIPEVEVTVVEMGGAE